MLKKHIKVAAVLLGIVTATVIAVSVVPQTYKTSVLLAQLPGMTIPSGLPAPMLATILQTVSSGIISTLESGSDVMQNLSYIPSKNSVFEGKIKKIYDTVTEGETALSANDSVTATNVINGLRILDDEIITSYAATSEGKNVKKKMGEDLAVTQKIVTAADGWVKSYSGDKSAVQEDLTAAKTSLAASNAEFSESKFPEAAINFANTIGSLVELLPETAPDTAVDELNFVYEKASALGLESSELKAKAEASSNAGGASSSGEDFSGLQNTGGETGKGGATVGSGSSGGGSGGGDVSSGNKGKSSKAGKVKGKDEKVSSKDSKKEKSSKVKKSEKDSSCEVEENASSKDKGKSTSKDKKTSSSKDKSSKVKKTDKNSSCDVEGKVSSKDKKKTTSKDKGKSKSKDKKSTSKKKTTDNKK